MPLCSLRWSSLPLSTISQREAGPGMEKKPWKQPRLRYWLHFLPYSRENRPDFMSNHKTKCFSSLHPSPWKMIPSLIFTDLTKSYNRSCFNFIFSHQLHSRERSDFMWMVWACLYSGLFLLMKYLLSVQELLTQFWITQLFCYFFCHFTMQCVFCKVAEGHEGSIWIIESNTTANTPDSTHEMIWLA